MPNLSPSRYCVRTSGGRSFRRCRRKWGYESSLRRNLQRAGGETNINFWFGTAIHWCMEDYFGYNQFGDPRAALKAYYDAFEDDEKPEVADQYYSLGIGMLDYFLEWYPKHNILYDFQTVWVDNDTKQQVPAFSENAHPLVEEQFMLDLGVPVWVRDDTGDIVSARTPVYARRGYTAIQEPHEAELAKCEVGATGYYWTVDDKGLNLSVSVHVETIKFHGTCDRICYDRNGDWWILDYKTAKGADTNKLDTDDQIARYLWAMEQWFQRPIKGFIYLQLTKAVVAEPKVLKNGQLSTDKRQKTTALKYKQAIINTYGSVQAAPAKVVETLNSFREAECAEGDKFIRWDLVTRTKEQKISTYEHILAEVADMIDVDRPLYPTPTRDCIWDCPFRDACLLEENKRYAEMEQYLKDNFQERPRDENGEMDEWRKNIKYPAEGEVPDESSWRPEDDLSDVVMTIIFPEGED